MDLIIRNAQVIDGTGAPPFHGDIGVEGDTIAALGDLSGLSAADEIDAGGQVASPGFIDLLGHSERALFTDPTLESKVRQGVTTEVTGEGTIVAPINDAIAAEREVTNRTKEPWRTMADFFAAVERNGTAINFAFLVTTSNARLLTVGRENRAATPGEIETMKRIVHQAMCEGAIGLSTALIYVPAVYSSTEEIIELATVAAEHDGVYFTHMRNEGSRIDSALEETFRIGRASGIPLNIWHLKLGGQQNWGKMGAVIARIEEARASGLDVAANVYPYIASKTDLAVLAPDWALEGGYNAFLTRLDDPRVRAELESQIESRGRGENILITEIHNEEFARFQKKRLSTIAAEMGVPPIDALVAIYRASRVAPGAMYFSMNEEDVKTALAQPWVSVGADSGAFVGDREKISAHPRGYGTFPRVVGHYVRNEKLFSLEEAVRKITSQAASRAKLWDRGILRPGMKADIVVFDRARIIDRSTYEDPHHYAEGISHVIVNGTFVLRDGNITRKLPGRVLRKTSGKKPHADCD